MGLPVLGCLGPEVVEVQRLVPGQDFDFQRTPENMRFDPYGNVVLPERLHFQGLRHWQVNKPGPAALTV